MSQRRIVITGMGLISPVGNTVASSWEAICNGRSGIGPLTEFDPAPLATRIAGEIRDFDVTQYIEEKDARRYDKFMHYGISAAVQSITDAGLAELERHSGITRLHLEQTKITDAGLGHLKGLQQLEYLNLYGTAITDAGLSHLAGLKNLKNLYVWQTKVTPEGGTSRALPSAATSPRGCRSGSSRCRRAPGVPGRRAGRRRRRGGGSRSCGGGRGGVRGDRGR